MEYKRSNNKNEYVKEIVNVSFSIGKLIKDPNYSLKNTAVGLIMFVICEACLIFFSIPTTVSLIKDHRVSTIVFACVVYSFTLLYGLFVLAFALVYLSRRKNWMKMKETDRHFDCDEEGVMYVTPDQQVKAYWKSIKAIRVFKYSMVIIPKDRKTIAILAPVENLEGFQAFLKEKNIDIPVYK